MWQRVCLTGVCGFRPFGLRVGNNTGVSWLYDQQELLRSDFLGEETTFRFTTESTLFQYSPGTQTFRSVSLFSSIVDCQNRSCFFGQRTCSGGANQGALCEMDGQCPGSSCTSLNSFRVLGASSFTHFSVGMEHYLIVANFWDGRETNVGSALFQIVGASGDFNATGNETTFFDGVRFVQA
eukprot:3459378-Rhodomonas_salina.1